MNADAQRTAKDKNHDQPGNNRGGPESGQPARQIDRRGVCLSGTSAIFRFRTASCRMIRSSDGTAAPPIAAGSSQNNAPRRRSRSTGAQTARDAGADGEARAMNDTQ